MPLRQGRAVEPLRGAMRYQHVAQGRDQSTVAADCLSVRLG
jgi:hypothetical protein